MPPRYSYWTIIAGGLPTAFRATERDELLPTFKRLQEKHPDAELKYFAQGRLWESQEEAQRAREAARSAGAPPPRRESRGKDWRPGGEHRDPRQKFIDQKKARNQRWRQDRFDQKVAGPGRDKQTDRRDRRPPVEKPHGDPLRKEIPPAFETRRPWPRKEGGGSAKRDFRPPRQEWGARPPRQEGGQSPARQNWRPKGPGDKPPAGEPRRQGGFGHKPPPFRPFNQRGGQTREDKPPREPRPDREPRRGDEDPNRPPRPSEPRIEPPGPPERGRSGPPARGRSGPPRGPAPHGPRRPFKKRNG